MSSHFWPPFKKIVIGTCVPIGGALAILGQFIAHKNLGAQHLLQAEIWSSEKVDLLGLIPHRDIYTYQAKVSQTFFSERGRNCG